MHHYFPQRCIIPPNGVLLPQKTYYQRPQNLYYYHAKCCITLLNPCIYLYSGYSQMHHYFRQRCIIPPKGVLLPRKMVCYSPKPLYLLVFRLFPQKSYYSRKMLYYSPEPLYLLVFRLFPQMSYYSPQTLCYSRKNLCYSPEPLCLLMFRLFPECRITRAKRCVTINE